MTLATVEAFVNAALDVPVSPDLDELAATIAMLPEEARRTEFDRTVAQRYYRFSHTEKEILWYWVQVKLDDLPDTIPEWSRSVPSPFSPSC